ncbi:MAG: hypothetical protein ACXAEU_10670 [Candidatus Hodarchaeales archaeon]|jgi:RimJ/RimL family protein N-acetyltransferase
MKFHPESKSVPDILETKEFLIRPLRTTDVELDYKAVIANRANLLKRTNGRWPKDGFTIKENLEDLRYHEEQQKERNEFTYTIMNLTETECLGCIYIHPLEESLKKNMRKKDISSLNIKNHEALVTFWVTPIATKQKLDKLLIEELKRWFMEEWAFSRVVLSFGPRMTAHESRIVRESDLPQRYSFDVTEGTELGWEIK